MFLFAMTLAWGMGIKAQGHFTEHDTIDVLHYDISLDMGHLQPQHMQGWCEVTVRMLQPSTEVGLGLMYATIDSVQVNGQTLGSREFSYDQKALQIPVGNAATGDTFRLKIYYGSQGWVGTDGGMWCEDDLYYNLGEDRRIRPFSMGRSWFPCSDSVYDRATYSFHITVAPGWTAVCSGEQTGIEENADSSRTFHFALQHPVSTYQVGCNAAPYRVYQLQAEGIYGTYPLQVACIDRDSAQVANDFSAFNQTLQLYERLFGPYRWENIRFSEGGPNAGMEHVNDICISFFYYDMFYLLDHEFAHQWFGNLITCAHLRDMWFNEGGATFADQLASTNRRNDNYDVVERKRIAMVEAPVRENGYHPLCGMPNRYSFLYTTYYKGAQVFHDLRNLLGDTTFFTMMQTLLQHNAYTNMDSYQLRDSMSLYSGVDLTDFYDFHIFGTGFSSYTVDSLRTTEGVTHLWLHQRLWHAADYCRQARVPVTFFSQEGDTMTCQVVSSGHYAEGECRLPFTPAYAIVDYYYKTASANFSNLFTLTSKTQVASYDTHFIIEPTSINDTVDLVVTMALGTNDEEPIPGVKRWDYRRWYVNGNYDNNFNAKTGFMFGQNSPVHDQEFYFGSATKDSLRLFYRKDASQPWKMRKTATIEHSSSVVSRTDYMQIIGTPLRGEFIMAVVDTALLDINDDASRAQQTSPKLSVSPNPAADYMEVAFNAHGAEHRQCRIVVVNASGKRVLEMRPEHHTTRVATKDWPAGIYFVTLTSPSGSATKKLIVQ